ncbi:hypothetical protein GF361_03330 [Candidatus Woesearchaeota archaeon]|nr:hypothetical protein [Candidatus Woesearchaeota archaeon]
MKLLSSKKAQLGIIEMKFAIIGLVIGIILTLAIIFLANKTGIIPFKLAFLCP